MPVIQGRGKGNTVLTWRGAPGKVQDGVSLRTNFVSDRGAAWYADLYRRDGLSGGHVIKLGPGNDHVAREALAAWPGGLQVGGGMTPENAEEWISSGASHVIVTSCLFDAEGTLRMDRLKDLVSAVGAERRRRWMFWRNIARSFLFMRRMWKGSAPALTGNWWKCWETGAACP